MQILIVTSDKTINALRGFSYFWNLYAYTLNHHRIDVCGYTPPSFHLPSNYSFTSLGDFANYPVQKWSDGFYKALHTSDDPIVLCLFDDYFMLRDVDVEAIDKFEEYMRADEGVLRFDLSSDRLYAEGIKDWGSIGHYDIIQSNTTIPYNFSLQAALWRRDLLKQLILPNETAWQTEMYANERLKQHPEWEVLGTRQVPMKYLISIQQGQLTLNGGYQSPRLDVLLEDNKPHFEVLRKSGYLRGL